MMMHDVLLVEINLQQFCNNLSLLKKYAEYSQSDLIQHRSPRSAVQRMIEYIWPTPHQPIIIISSSMLTFLTYSWGAVWPRDVSDGGYRFIIGLITLLLLLLFLDFLPATTGCSLYQ